jgi:hypothetical protein
MGVVAKVPALNACSCLVRVAAETASLLVNPPTFTVLEHSLLRDIAIEELVGKL